MIEINNIICGDCLEIMKELKDNSVDAVVTDPPYGLAFMGKNTCIVYGIYDIMGLCKHFGTKLKKQILAGFGLAQIMVQGMAKYESKERNSILIDSLMNGLKGKYLLAFRLTTFVEIGFVVILNTLKQLLRKLMCKGEIQVNPTLLKHTA